MNFFRRIKKAWAIKSYVRRMPKLLKADHGKSKYYSPYQVKSTVQRHNLNSDYLCYAIAMYSIESDFDAYHHETGQSCDYKDMRTEVAEQYLDGKFDFSTDDLDSAAASYEMDVSGSETSESSGSDDVGGGD